MPVAGTATSVAQEVMVPDPTLSAQRLGSLDLGTQTWGPLRAGCAQGIELFGGGRVREVRGPR
ncbi:hypothetical protein [Streptomyces longwoodensis]|uniref:hypothetical protein n=1 Tax=Streptomyces longwoodensis TaxID=68231 RepID=UPI00384D232D